MPQLQRIGPDVKRRTLDIPLENGIAATCGVCAGFYRAPLGIAVVAPVCPGCRAEAGRLAALGDPRRASA